ncbi:hypothetical protein [Micromonospora fulviviridis]|uniref:Uncharacterized protein n=1 Tax=Micromonospora fulviviridis TaxID=47860 RepID=A0ABV2VDM4_9ACTN
MDVRRLIANGREVTLSDEEFDVLVDAIDYAQHHFSREADLLAGRESERDRTIGREHDTAASILEGIRRALGDPGRDPDVAVPDTVPDDMEA